ncbi:MAG: hypothetical protein QOI24_3456 [Acidobacteriota bacterium]|jgi:hypothetical protein|nr:hypothetical protein [Acidobacteriota bacterium]
MLSRFGVAVFLITTASAAFAATYVVPEDRDLIDRAHAIVVAKVIDTNVRFEEASGIVTVATLRVTEGLKGVATNDVIEVYEPGGTYGGMTTVIAGVPKLVPGERLLLMLRTRPDGKWAVMDLALGKFRFAHDESGQELLEREDISGWDSHLRPFEDSRRSAKEFLDFVRAQVRGDSPVTSYNLPAPSLKSSAASVTIQVAPFTAGSYTIGPARRPGFSSNVVYGRGLSTEPGAAGGGDNAINAAFSAWVGVSGTDIKLLYNGQSRSDTGVQPNVGDGKNTVQFERDISWAGAGPFTCNGNSYSGVLGIGGYHSTGTHPGPNGETFETITEGDVEMNVGIANCTVLFASPNRDFDTAVTHEVGHSIGFRHSDQTPSGSAPCSSSPSTLECSSSAIMKAFIPSGIHAAPQTWDIHAAQAVYPGAVVCTPPSISNVSGTATITAGSSTPLSVTASGTTTLTYQWYTGASGNTSNPVSGGTSSQISVSPTTTTTYWVRVTGQCAPVADSSTVTVTVTPCVAPSISNQPASVSISSGTNTSLSVTASGSTPFTYQWYIGASPSTASPTGGNSSTLNVSPSATTPYWVKVTNACGSANSNTATVTVTCVAPLIVTQPSDQTIVTGNTATLTLGHNNSNPSVVWYQGTAPDTQNPVGTSRTITTGPLTQTTKFWAQLSNSCGVVNSRTMTVTVVVNCSSTAITSVTANPSTISFGLATTLTVVATGTSLSYQWYVGASGNTSSPLNGATSDAVSVTATGSSTYWVRVSSGCGAAAVDSVAVPVTVVTCVAPTALTISGPANIPPGSTATLTATVTGSPTLVYQWFQGSNGDTTKPVGTDNLTFITPPLTTDTLYWVRVQNTCGGADALNYLVVVKPGRRRSANH